MKKVPANSGAVITEKNVYCERSLNFLPYFIQCQSHSWGLINSQGYVIQIKRLQY